MEGKGHGPDGSSPLLLDMKKWPDSVSPAQKMKDVSLQPSDTGKPGGKETGQKVSHYVIENGAFAKAFAKLEGTGFKLRWQFRPFGEEGTAGKKAAGKTKYTCPSCGTNAWAKPHTALICGECYEDGEG
jgi:hypothetical protein